MDEDRLLLAVDGGQTATKSLLTREDGHVLATGRGGPSDHFHIEGGRERNRAAILGAIRTALDAAAAKPESVAAIGLGLTGAYTSGLVTPIVEEIAREVLPAAKIAVRPDFITNLLGASGGEPGVVVIAGGGSIAYCLAADGREALAGGFGYLLGDEGSAFDIGRRAITAALRASDGRDAPTALSDIVREAFGVEVMRDVARTVYRAGFSRERISRLAPEVARAARDGDATAQRIMRTAGEELGLVALAAIRQIHMPGEPVSVYPMGGVFAAGDLILDPFRAALQAGWPAATVRPPRFPPVVGALILARRAIGREADSTWLGRVAASLEW